ncbi:SLIT and NTRK-like protein 1, partial [Sitodiplosis mosellana]|uniref:SLIT and NTRK-like protein 1 n=1 Tax=Sitodiplosis mosellana TaxID=263140 RepID=UPI002444265E
MVLNANLEHTSNTSSPWYPMKVSSLKRLNLANASIRAIGDSLFSSNNSILEWDLSHNEVVTLRRTQFQNLKQLRLLNLMDNSIKTIEQNTFEDLNQLTHLNLRFNRKRALELLGRLNRLNVLDLGESLLYRHNNKIEWIPQKTFEDISQLTELQTKHNRLTFLPTTKKAFNNLQKLSVEGNPWQCACLMEIFNFVAQQSQRRRIEYYSANNPFYSGLKLLCYEPPVKPAAPCVRDIDL